MLKGTTVRLVLGGRQHVVGAGEAALFATMTPHSGVGVGGFAQILMTWTTTVSAPTSRASDLSWRSRKIPC